jgi:hypothetical protein
MFTVGVMQWTRRLGRGVFRRKRRAPPINNQKSTIINAMRVCVFNLFPPLQV